jgi:hypothetical protein
MKRTLKRKDIKAYKLEKMVREGNTCPITNIVLDASNAVLDHDHTSGRCREVIDRNLNQYIGKLESNYKRFLGYRKDVPSLPTILRMIADYIDTNYATHPYHPGWADLQVRKFSRENKLTQDGMLIHRGIKPEKTSKERTKQFKKWFYES